MNQKSDIIAALDVGTTKIVAVIAKRDLTGKIRIMGLGRAPSLGVKRGVVNNAEDTATAILTAVDQAEASAGIKMRDVVVGIAGQHIKSFKNRHSKYIQNTDNEIFQKDVDELTSDMYKIALEAGEEIIHVIPQNYIVDGDTGINRPVGMYGKKLEANFHIVVGQVGAAKMLKKCVEKAGLRVSKLVLEPLASADAVLTEDEKEAGVALVDIGGGTTDLAVFYDGIIRHTSVVPFGGNVITNDIKEGLNIIQRYAEALKIKYGSALADIAPENKVVTIPAITEGEHKEVSFKSLSHIIQARMDEIINKIVYEIENSGFIEKLGAGIALTGGGALLKNLPQLVKFRTGLDVRVANPRMFIFSDGFAEINQPMYSTSVGLILKGFEYLDSTKEIGVEEEISEEFLSEEPVVKHKPNKIFDLFKSNLTNLFDEKDSTM